MKLKGESYLAYAALWGVPGILVLVEAYRLADSPYLKNTSFSEGPLAYMSAVGLLLIGFGVSEIVAGLRKRQKASASVAAPATKLSRKAWICVALMFLFLVLIPVLGFVLASGCFLVGSLYLLGCKAKAIIITTLAYCLSLYLLLPYLGLSLPHGLLGI
jgi:hypothetical protein